MGMLEFSKMHGLGNDFVVIDGLTTPIALSTAQVRHIADRRFGVGCDQILIAEPATRHDADVRYRIYNRDGSETEHCGNGVRCLARFLHDRGLANGRELRVETANGLAVVRLREDGQVTVDMGVPVLEPAAIPFRAPERAPRYPLELDGRRLEVGAVSMGNPHLVLEVADVDTAPVESDGPLLERHPDFPNRVNVGFMQVRDRGSIRLRVYERGAGETLACGTGACAAVVAGRLWGRLDGAVTAQLPGGSLLIEWDGEGGSVHMTGPASHVFDGLMSLPS